MGAVRGAGRRSVGVACLEADRVSTSRGGETMNAKLLGWILLPIAGLLLVGMVAVWLLQQLLGVVVYLLVGAVVVGGGFYLYQRVRREVGPGTRTGNRIEAASRTYRNRG